MLYTKINYYFHLLLTNKYSFVIKLAILLSIYMLFTIDNPNEIAYCAKKKALAKAVVPTLTETTSSTPIRSMGDIFELEKIKVHEKIIAYTHMEPEELINEIERSKAFEAERTGNPIEFYSAPNYEKEYIQAFMPSLEKAKIFQDKESETGFVETPTTFYDHEGLRKVYSWLRIYRRLTGR